MHPTSLFYWQWSNQACNTVHVTGHERQRFIRDVETATFVQMHPCEENKDGCRELLTLPRTNIKLALSTIEFLMGAN